MLKKITSLFCALTILFSGISFMIPVYAQDKTEGYEIESNDIPLRLHYDEEASHGVAEGYDNTEKHYTTNIAQVDKYANDDWERWSLPIGNGYIGANIFGRTETERIQISEQSLFNPNTVTDPDGNRQQLGGYNNFSETYIDFGHTNSDVTSYERYLDLKTAISGVSYVYEGVTYTREYFTSYPDKVLVIRLDSSKEGALSFTLRPTVPWEQDYSVWEGDGASKTGSVSSYISDDGEGVIELSGKMGYYDIDFLGIYHVVTDGGNVSASTTLHTYTDTAGVSHTDEDGTIVVSGANSAYIYVNIGTDYELSEEMFTASNENKPTFSTDIEYTRAKVEAEVNAVKDKLNGKSYNDAFAALKNNHLNDYTELFGRVTLDLGDVEDAALTTDELLEKYKNGEYSAYLETLYFQYGRYLLIASSRENSLPANLQGVWNRYNKTPWSGGYWHNVNIQMNYWPAFSTNLTETFEAYVKYNDAYMSKAELYANSYVNSYNPPVSGEDGGNGWCIGIGTWPYAITGDRSGGNLGFTTQLYWDYYQYTKDKTILEQIVYPILVSAARYIVKTVELDENGNYLVSYCDSPEMFVDGVWYYTKGTTYAQTFAYLNNYNALLAAKELGIDLTDSELLSKDEYSIFKTVIEQIDKYDPIVVGLSGQIKEFREEDYYCSVGDEPHHRHTSQLVGLYPGNIINSTTPAWLDAAKVTLNERGDEASGWGIAFRLNMWARTKDGERSYDLLNQLLSTSTATNLWDLHPPFQIDGNLGGTAGIAEMLLQSHEGYIAPLAAIPEKWQNGSYTGLVARGNFEVSAVWENGTATIFNISSKSGEEAVVYYPSITGATVVTASGKKVNYTVVEKDMISFETEVGETYIISGFKSQESVEAPDSVSFVREGRFGAFSLNWTAVESAASYNVYVAVESAPNYTLIGNTTENSMVYIPNSNEENARTTFAVTSVGASGVESSRTLCYSNPEDVSAKAETVSAGITDNNELQVIIKANSNTGKYRLYEKKYESTEYTLIEESGFPILYATEFNDSSTYYVSVVSAYSGEESDLIAIGSYANVNDLQYDVSNIFTGKEFIGLSGTDYSVSSGYEYSKLTDGIIDTTTYKNGRFSTATNKKADATIDLGETYILSELRFYLFEKRTTHIGTNFTVQVYSEGNWITIVENVSNADLISKYCKTIGSGKDGVILSFDLGLIKGSKIRFYSESTEGSSVTFYEAKCSGIRLDEKYTYSDNILIGKDFIGSEPVISAGGVVFDYDKLNDGVISSTWNVGRYSSATNGKMNATVELDAVYSLNKLKLYAYGSNVSYIGNNLKIEYYDGAWKTLVHIESNADVEAYKVSADQGIDKTWFEFDFDGVLAEKIRVSSTAISGSTVTLYEIECSGTLRYDKFERDENIFANKTIIGSEPVISAGGVVFDYDKLNDGVISSTWNVGRYSSATNGKMNATVELGGVYRLDKLRLYHFNQDVKYVGNNLKVEVYYEGEWKTVVHVENYSDLSAYKASDGSGLGHVWIEFDLHRVFAQSVRVSSDSVTGSTVTLYEMECSGYKAYIETLENTNKNAFEKISSSVNVSGTSADQMFDGDFNTYFEADSTESYSVTIDLNTPNILYSLKIYELIEGNHLINGVISTASDSTMVEIYRNGSWVTIAKNVELNANAEYTEIYLYGTECSQVRITFTNTRLFDGETTIRSAKIKELTCTAADKVYIDRKDMLEAYSKLSDLNATDSEYLNRMEIFNGYLTDTTLTEEEIEASIFEMNDYFNYFVSDTIAKIDFVPKTSITLESQLVMNVYIPIKSTQSFTLDGVTYDDFANISKIVVDGKEYYHMTVSLPSSEAAREFKLVAVVKADNGVSATATFTLSIPRYASKILANGDTSNVEQTLVRDVLQYIKSAYIYFGSTDSDALATIDTLLGTYVSSPKIEGNYSTSYVGLKGATFVLNEKPVIRFYLSDGADARDYRFYIDGKNVSFKASSDGTYVDIDVYAYALSETVTYTVKGIEGGNYHIRSYYEYVSGTGENDYNGTDKETLIALTSSFWKYVQSAADYRDAAIGVEN